MKAHLYIARAGDREFILQPMDEYRKLADADLQQLAEKKRQQGFFGSHAQALHVLAFHFVMLERFNDSPVSVENESLIRFKEPGQK